jgi:hypothetical protein
MPNKTRKPVSKRKPKTQFFPFRTTLSMRQEWGQRLDAIARSQQMSTMDAARLAVQRWVLFHEAVKDPGVAEHAQRVLEHSLELRNPYQRMVATWRLARAEHQVADIAHSSLDLEAFSAEVYLVRVLTELLDGLGEHDEFLTTTNLGFWHAAGGSFMGPERSGLYLAAQTRAIDRGMKLHRVFLLDKQQINSPDLQQHHAFVERHRSNKHVHVEYKECVNVDEGVSQFGHFACIRRRLTTSDDLEDEGCLIVEPVAFPTTLLRMLFSSGASRNDRRTKFYVERFFSAAQGAVSLDRIDRKPQVPSSP